MLRQQTLLELNFVKKHIKKQTVDEADRALFINFDKIPIFLVKHFPINPCTRVFWLGANCFTVCVGSLTFCD